MVLNNGKRMKVQRKYMMFTLSEAHQLFLKDHPSLTISYSHFTSLRPPQCLHLREIPENVCLCVYHENFRLLLKALHTCTVNVS